MTSRYLADVAHVPWGQGDGSAGLTASRTPPCRRSGKSQFTDQEAGCADLPAFEEIRGRVEAMARFYGMLAGVKYAEPFLQKEVGLVEDLTALRVKSI